MANEVVKLNKDNIEGCPTGLYKDAHLQIKSHKIASKLSSHKINRINLDILPKRLF